MVEIVPLRADKPSIKLGTDREPTAFQPAVYQTGAEINVLRGGRKLATPHPLVLVQGSESTPPDRLPDREDHRPKREVSPEEKAAIERNSVFANQLFPGKQDEELRNAAYRYLMFKECHNGYPKISDSDMELLKKAGVLAKLDSKIEEDSKKGLINGTCGTIS
jgi:hypothetical protein